MTDTIARCVRLPDAYLWGKGYALDVLCGLAVAERMPQAPAWVEELHGLAARSGMRELTVRSYLHRAALGDGGSGAAARLLADEIDNPMLSADVDHAVQTQGNARVTPSATAPAASRRSPAARETDRPDS